jgi:hypothetical protein
MSVLLQVDNKKAARDTKSGMWIAVAVLVINGVILWIFDIADVLKLSALGTIAALLPLLVWIVLNQKVLIAEVDAAGIRIKEEMGNEAVIRNEINFPDIDRIFVVEEGKSIAWCRIKPKSGKGILLGNFGDKAMHIIRHLQEEFPDKIAAIRLDAGEKAEKRKNDCLL